MKRSMFCMVAALGLVSVSVAAVNVPRDCRLCNGDVNRDGLTDGADLSIILSNFGKRVNRGTRGDLNNDGRVTNGDMEMCLNNFDCRCWVN